MSSTTPEVIETRLSWEGDIALLTINNISRRNAISDPVKEQMLEHLTGLVDNRKCRAIVLSGAGGHFCAGGDVKAMKSRTSEGETLIHRRLRMGGLSHRIVRLLVEGPKPVVTAIEGSAFGGGLALAMASDVSIASRSARFGGAQILRGLCPDVGLLYLLSSRAGPGRARELLLSGRTFGPDDALKYGVVHEVVDEGGALDAALRTAQQLAAVPPLAYALTKSAITHSNRTLEDAFRAEQNYQPVLGLSKDHAESVAAFMAKRRPVFTGE